MTEDFLSAYPAFREPIERGDKIIGETWFSVWEKARAFENAECRAKLLKMFNLDYVIDADECAAAIGLRIVGSSDTETKTSIA